MKSQKNKEEYVILDGDGSILSPSDFGLPTKENSCYLVIRQIYFDEIMSGRKKIEYRDLNPTNRKKFLVNDKWPYKTRDIRFLNLAVGYAKERDTATVEVTGFTFKKNYPFDTIEVHLGNVVECKRGNKKK